MEPGLFIGDLEAATDVESLELHKITHIVTVSDPGMSSGVKFSSQVDTVPLPRKMTSLLPRLQCLHIKVLLSRVVPGKLTPVRRD